VSNPCAWHVWREGRVRTARSRGLEGCPSRGVDGSRPDSVVRRLDARMVLRRAAAGWAVALCVLGLAECGVRLATPLDRRPPRMDRFSLADVGAGAYVHRRDATAGAWLEVVDGRVRTRPARRVEGVDAVDVPEEPEPGVVRVVALGGSTTRGVPYDHLGGGFVSELAPPPGSGERWEVLNLGVPGMDARGVARMAREARALQPDLVVLYTGNNEVMGDLLDHCVRPGRIWTAATLDRLVGYRLLRTALLGAPTPAGSAEAFDAQDQCMGARIAESWAHGRRRLGGALDPVAAPGVSLPGRRWDLAAGQVAARVVDALDQVAHQAALMGAPVVVARPPVNLRHPPGRALGAPGSTAATARTVDDWMVRAEREGLAAWTEAVRTDPHRADALHGWGLSRLAEGRDPEPAVRALRAAVDHDYAARRPTSDVLDAIDDACARWPHLHCVAVDDALARQAGSEVLPGRWFADHCHPSEEGNRRIGAVLSEAMRSVLAAESR